VGMFLGVLPTWRSYVSRFASAFFRRLPAIARLRSRSFAKIFSFSLNGSFASSFRDSLLIEIPVGEIVCACAVPADALRDCTGEGACIGVEL
ncbi:MAG: hypothetical protein WCC59_13415, partial [Terriglobales bacterium]